MPLKMKKIYAVYMQTTASNCVTFVTILQNSDFRFVLKALQLQINKILVLMIKKKSFKRQLVILIYFPI